ncbi:methyl-accepting chemotaxis protein [Clostridium oryzae]|uniref:Methyl-accepting chemotaxis protein III n=1 Tax=Clostridium oryzae TaxID=1450648 RepID=A0A1V4IPC3_9CLOT|nr:methyl-accepting chemotaxis protein [Clostridium oryzae]OPJ61901.1 methyl-accepting chemotaxis protein III [Clostridium oryzae]
MKFFNNVKLFVKLVIGFFIVSIASIATFTAVMSPKIDYGNAPTVLVALASIIIINGIIAYIICRSITDPLGRLTSIVNDIADGNIDMKFKLKRKDEIGILENSLEKLICTFTTLVGEQLKVNKLADEGKLNARCNTEKVNGIYKEILEGTNNMLDNIVLPITEAKGVLGRMAVNDYTVSMRNAYGGQLNELAEAINTVQERIFNVVDIFNRISKGDISRLEEFKKLGKRSDNDELMPACVRMMDTIKELIEEVEALADSTINGILNVRGNENKFEGGYQEVINGMNRTMNAVVKPINEAVDIMQKMAKGDLTANMSEGYKGEYALLSEAINNTIKSFNEVLNNINGAAEQVAAGAKQISDSAQELSQSSTEQASSVEELTASLEQISAQTQQNADNANQANEMGIVAKETALSGNKHMENMLRAMEEINESSNNISKIIKVIDEIAFQTNILALNVAVEAARAGQHGKGFAVVAEEVRNLAARSANAAKETTVLIESSMLKVDDGTKIANDTALALDKIVESVAKVDSLVEEIAIASNEQASAISQINQGIIQVSQVVQTNSATSEESASASEELASQAQLLRNLVNRFELNKMMLKEGVLEELSPEILKMLENMKNEKSKAESSSKIKIDLSDTEFGKY